MLVEAHSQLDPTEPLCTAPKACPTPPCDKPQAALQKTSAGTLSRLGCAPEQGRICKGFLQPSARGAVKNVSTHVPCLLAELLHPGLPSTGPMLSTLKRGSHIIPMRPAAFSSPAAALRQSQQSPAASHPGKQLVGVRQDLPHGGRPQGPGGDRGQAPSFSL